MAYELFQVTQGAIIKNSEGAILILELENGFCLLPGGHVDRNEDWFTALARELKEEIGLEKFTLKKIVDITCWAQEGHSVYAVTFLVEPIDFTEPKLSDEHTKYAWVPEADLGKCNFLSHVSERLKKSLSGTASL